MPTHAVAPRRYRHKWWRPPLGRLLRSYVGKRVLQQLGGEWPRRLASAASQRQLFWSRERAGGRLAILVTHELSPSGAPRVLADAARALFADEWRVIIVSAKDGVFRPELVAAGATVIVSEAALGPGSPAIGLARHADLLICNTIVTGVVAAMSMAAVPTILYLHETSVLTRIARDSQETAKALGGAAQVWASSEIVADAVRPYRSDVTVMYPAGFDCGFRPKVVTGERLRLGVFGSIEPRKGQDALIGALELVGASTPLEVNFWGEIRDEQFAEKFKTMVAADSRLHYAGVVRPEQVKELMAGLDLVVVPSREEPFSLVALEALSAGVPLIITQVCGASRVLVDGVSAFVAEDATSESLAAAIDRAIIHRNQWSEIGIAGRATFESRFTAAGFRTRFLSQIERVWEERGRELIESGAVEDEWLSWGDPDIYYAVNGSRGE